MVALLYLYTPRNLQRSEYPCTVLPYSSKASLKRTRFESEADKRPKGQASQCFYWKTLRTRRQTSGPRDKRANFSIGKHYVHGGRQAAQGTSEPIFLLENTTYTEADKRPKGQASQFFYWKTLRTQRQTSGPRDKRANVSIGKHYVHRGRQALMERTNDNEIRCWPEEHDVSEGDMSFQGHLSDTDNESEHDIDDVHTEQSDDDSPCYDTVDEQINIVQSISVDVNTVQPGPSTQKGSKQPIERFLHFTHLKTELLTGMFTSYK
ncbi:hypothetical protein J6590_075616 [Homalodisca vitripennis]|nr:hypothetical protein J6590_075616 [Homalodisca vitripennis]